jgi:hypothetical protein
MMRIPIILLIFGMSISTLSADSLLPCDKGAHFGVSFIGFQASALAFRGSDDLELKATVVTLGLGLCKELYDLGIKRESFSIEDLLFDALGALVAYALIRWNRSLGP